MFCLQIYHVFLSTLLMSDIGIILVWLWGLLKRRPKRFVIKRNWNGADFRCDTGDTGIYFLYFLEEKVTQERRFPNPIQISVTHIHLLFKSRPTASIMANWIQQLRKKNRIRVSHLDAKDFPPSTFQPSNCFPFWENKIMQISLCNVLCLYLWFEPFCIRCVSDHQYYYHLDTQGVSSPPPLVPALLASVSMVQYVRQVQGQEGKKCFWPDDNNL